MPEEEKDNKKICKYCKSYEYLDYIKEGRCKERHNEKTEEDSSCSFFEKKDISNELKDCYYTIIDILKQYCDLEEKYYPVVALWIIGTYAHDEFETYPYLYLNASKGSGKSRALRLISTLSKNGRLIGSLTEAVLFRTAKDRTFCIDEFESISSKENSALRELLNSGYKKGLIIERSNKKKTIQGESWIIETYNVYTSIAMANIWGMEEVLGDRCITLILEKSSNPKITKLIENFDKDFSIQKIKALLNDIKDNLSLLVSEKGMSQYWNDYIRGNLKTSDELMIDFFKKVDGTEIQGRDLELLLPLYFVAYLIDENALDNILKTSKEIVKEREEEDYLENKDKILIRFLSDKLKEGNLELLKYVSITNICNQFREYLGEGNDWINSKWLGRALKRLKLLKDRKRENQGIKVLINIDKISKLSCVVSVV